MQHFTPEERLEIAARICKAYARTNGRGEGLTWKQAIRANKIGVSTFQLWKAEIEQIELLFKKAKKQRLQADYKDLKLTARSKMQREINEGVKRVRRKGVPDASGKLVTTEVIEDVLPTPPSHYYFVLKNLDPAFEENKPANTENISVKIEGIDWGALTPKTESETQND